MITTVEPAIEQKKRSGLEHPSPTEIFYPSEDDEPLAETQEHIWVIANTLNILAQYLKGKEAVVFAEKLQGYRLNAEGMYHPIGDSCSQVLQLRLEPQGYSIGFYRLDNNEKLLSPDELLVALQSSDLRAKAAEERADRLAQKLQELGIDP